MNDMTMLYGDDPAFLSAILVRRSDKYEDFASGVYGLLRLAKDVMEESMDLKFDSKAREDGITISIRNILAPYRANIAMEHVNSNADLVFRDDKRRFRWVGEAKILSSDYSNDHLYEGALQQASRYSAGGDNERHGGLLIYNFKSRTAFRMNEWKSYFFDKANREAESEVFLGLKECVLEGHDCCNGFFTSHSHQSSGLDFVMAHIPFSFNFNPQDKSARKSK